MTLIRCCYCFRMVRVIELHTDGWGVTVDVCKPCADAEAQMLGWRPCPTCQLRHGFHDDKLHAARVSIPANKLLPKGWLDDIVVREIGDPDDYPGGWFGPSWGAPACEERRHRLTPVGERCIYCHVAFVDGDQGLTMPQMGDDSWRLVSAHIDCFGLAISPEGQLT